jgi:hypothetical protein
MPNVFLNGSPYALDPIPATWNDLINGLDRRLETDGLAIAAVRFDGVDEAGFRDAAQLARPLTPSLIVEVDAEPQGALILRCLDEASASIPEIAQAAIDLAANYRLVDVTEANAQLGIFAEALSNLMALVAAAGQVLRVDLLTAPPRAGGLAAADVIPQLDAALKALAEAHAGQDWITLADGLEYDVAPLVSHLSGLVDHLASATPA